MPKFIAAAALVVTLAAGFGSGYVANDQLGDRDRTVTVQHKRDQRPDPNDIGLGPVDIGLGR